LGHNPIISDMKKIVTAVFTLASCFVSIQSLTNNNGPGGAYTNAPNESNCTSCHSGSLNSGGSLSNLKLADNFTGGGYIPDSTYVLKVQMSHSSISKWGFNITALVASDDSPAGDFTITSNRTQRRTKSVSGKTRKYVEHTSSGTSSTSTNATEWEFKWTAPSSNVGDIKFYVALNAANGNGGNSGDKIYATDFTAGPSSLLPDAEIVSNDTLICSGAVAQFKNKTSGVTAYDWIFPNGSPSVSSDSAPKANYNFPGNQIATLRVKNSKGWSQRDTFSIKVLQSPTAFIPGNSTQKMCKGGSLDLTASFRAGYTYLWSTGVKGNVLTVTDTGSYYVFVTSGSCEKVSNAISVEFYDDVIEDLSSDFTRDSICKGEFVNLSTGAGYDSFFWYSNDVLIAKTDTNIFQTRIDSSTRLTVRVMPSTGCLGSPSDTISYLAVEKDSAPRVTCKNKEPFSVEFDWTGLQSHGGAQVSLNKGTTWLTPSSGASGNSHTLTGLTPDQDYELWVRGKMSAPCFYTEVAKQVCRTGKCSPLEAKIKADSMVCDGQQLRVELNGLSNERFSLSFEGGQPFTDTIFSFTPLVDKTYTIEVLDSSFLGCPAQKLSFPVHIDKIELLQFYTQKPNNSFCQGDTVQFTASSGNDDYRFYVNDVLKTTTQDSFYYESQFADGDSAYVEVSKGACVETSETIFLNLVPTPTATFSYSNVGSQYSFKPDNGNYQTYFWDFGDGFTSVLEEPKHSYLNSSGKKVTVSLNVKDNSDCVSASSDEIQLGDFSSIERIADDQLSIYPSPTRDFLHIDWLNGESPNMAVTITNLNGSRLVSHQFRASHAVIDVSTLPSGVYLLEIKSEKGFLVRRLFKQ